MLENADANTPSRDDERNVAAADYLRQATEACDAGDAVLGMHLYLAAFEQASGGVFEPGPEAVDGLKQAWKLACRLQERSLAEYIFEKMEPYLSSDEAAECASQLQGLALAKLEEFGLSREELEDMADMISQDFLGLDARVVKVEHLGSFSARKPSRADDAPAQDAPGKAADEDAAASDVGKAKQPDASSAQPSEKAKGGMLGGASSALAKIAEEVGVNMAKPEERLTYEDVPGYHDAVQAMRDFGVGLQDDPDFNKLVGMLNARHGVERMPIADSLLFRSPAREDANRFLDATLGELSLPVMRMRMEDSLSGMPMLCVTTQTTGEPKLNRSRNAFVGSGVLVLENLDCWMSPDIDSDEFGGFPFAALTRGAREAISLIRSAVENPDVYVLASAASGAEIDGFFLDMLEPLSLVEIDYPTPEERVDIWMDIARRHPSVRSVNRADLVRYSANMPRCDMYLAVREAIEEAYKESLVTRRYVPVTRDNLFDKLAAYQPLDSREYRELEAEVLKDFRADLEHIDDLLKG